MKVAMNKGKGKNALVSIGQFRINERNRKSVSKSRKENFVWLNSLGKVKRWINIKVSNQEMTMKRLRKKNKGKKDGKNWNEIKEKKRKNKKMSKKEKKTLKMTINDRKENTKNNKERKKVNRYKKKAKQRKCKESVE